MEICLLALLLFAAFRGAMRPVFLRKAASPHAAAIRQAMPAPGQTIEIEVLPEPPPAELPEPPVLQPAPVEILDRAEIFRRLRELELGVAELRRPLPEHERIVAAAIAAIGDAATQRRYAPRRPNLLPQLMRAISDEEVSRRELAAIIARDPSLVGSLLKMANSAFYRTLYPVETIERAIVILGSEGLRSLMAAALMQPIFQVSSTGSFPRFPEIVWEHAMRSAHAAIPHAVLVERADPFAAELLGLISGLAEIVLFRAALDHCANSSPKGQPDPLVFASLLDSQSAALAWRIGADWELSELMLAALAEQMLVDTEPTTPLGRSLRFGRCAGALAVLHTNSIIDEGTLKQSLPESGLSASHLKSMWKRLLQQHEDPRIVAAQQARASRATARAA
jgi:HD-like signal output (HDOD) protein